MRPVPRHRAPPHLLPPQLYPPLHLLGLLSADRHFFRCASSCTAAHTRAALLWRAKSTLRLPVPQLLPHASYLSVLLHPRIHRHPAPRLLSEAARRGAAPRGRRRRHARVGDYGVPHPRGDRGAALIALLTTLTRPPPPPPMFARGAKPAPLTRRARVVSQRGADC